MHKISDNKRPASRTYIAIAAGIVLAAILCLYYFLDPSTQEFMPKCAIHSLTGFNCPSCGNQRALHSFMHGDFLPAVRYNVFALYSVPYFVAVIVCSLVRFRSPRMQRMARAMMSRQAALLYVGLFVVWGIARNIIGI